ncbi:succinate dehydrogenase, cytochrome b556 subunit [Algicella marina]|uniref:Succinate dehydrogenase cytochrome b556 subunit n=1 Tax=Algicella marina TaxID=2683284 RepID=A0A6P1T013_9RHOB|nr:succinate dehydrogenase, cytochrome b556 subunit [Algicella marina]QHQ36264.1 succinate dehydrogenase, cytochrome b556 subunit [Algicella marina]
MADVNRGNRPLSPHVTVQRPALNWITSIVSRAVAIGLSLTILLVVWWFVALSSGEGAFRFADDLITSWIGGLILIGSLAALWFHVLVGIRHLYWDTGSGYEIDKIDKSSYVVIGGTVVLTLITLIVAF